MQIVLLLQSILVVFDTLFQEDVAVLEVSISGVFVIEIPHSTMKTLRQVSWYAAFLRICLILKVFQMVTKISILFVVLRFIV